MSFVPIYLSSCYFQKGILRLGQKVMLPASNMDHKFVPYIVVAHKKGGGVTSIAV